MDDIIPLFDPKAVHAPYQDELREAQARVLESGRFIGGEEVEAFEEELAKAEKCEYAVAVGSGTDALALAMIACDYAGKVVAIPALTFVGTLSAAIRAGCARTVLCDVDDNGLLNSSDIPEECQVAVPVALYGQDVTSSFDNWGLVVDGCQSSRYDAGPEATAISFFPTKPLGGFGDGGAVLTPSSGIATAIRQLRQHGRSLCSGEIVRAGGWNSRLDAVQAAMLRVVLAHRPEADEQRSLYASRYDALVEKFDEVHAIAEGGFGLYRSMYPVGVPSTKRRRVQETLWAQGVEARPYYPAALSETLHGSRRCPNAEQIAHSNLCLPLYPRMPGSICERVDTALRESLS